MMTAQSTVDPILSTFSDADLARAERNAWREAARSWQEYRSNTEPDLSNMLNESAWSAEHHWRRLYDACKARGLGFVGGMLR